MRASDFYGPGVSASMLGDLTVGRLAKGKAAQVVGDSDQPHSFAYVPDTARALVAVGDVDAAMGQAWNVPNAPDSPHARCSSSSQRSSMSSRRSRCCPHG